MDEYKERKVEVVVRIRPLIDNENKRLNVISAEVSKN